jgi:hypothetical protein
MRTIVPAPKSLRELAQEKLGDALFLDVMRAEAEDPGDPEMRRYLCHDLNDVLSSCHTMETVMPSQMDDPMLFQIQLRW